MKLVSRLIDKFNPGKFPDRLSGGIVSFSFDDVPASAWLEGNKILTEYGLKATYFVCTGLMGTFCPVMDERLCSLEDVKEIAMLGHEVGSHTVNHLVAADSVRASLFSEEYSNSLQAIIDMGLVERGRCGFAYPKGQVSSHAISAASRLFSYARGIASIPNTWPYQTYILSSYPLYSSRVTAEQVETVLKSYSSTNSWIIFRSHDVKPNPSAYGCSQELLKSTIDTALRNGYKIMTIGQVIAMAKR